MKNRLYIWLISVFLSIPYFAFSTHIVGGSLTYIYNGGSNYTITLKLYRDCSPTSAAFPGSVTINVAGYNGATFTPSKDIVINLGTVTTITPVLDPCAIAPNPMPCVQEGLYILTVNNLPPNPGGYHLSYQIIARNLSLTNINATCNCVGETYYAYIPGSAVYWGEDFTLGNATTIDNGVTAWSISAGATPPATASVNNNLFEIKGANNGQQTWTSQIINISAFGTGVNLKVDLSENGTLDANDTVFVYYRLNGGSPTLFSVNGFIVDDFGSAIASQATVIGNTVQIIIRVHYDAASPNSEIYRFDNVLVDGNNFKINNNPVFKLFPPLFLCVGQPFTFDHSATDTNGDSLYYSFYTPYNGDNGVGALDPTFLGNAATFTPIIFQPGYSYTNPLGGPLNLNSTTGLLTGIPSSLGQFVVGVMVKDYRNGVYLSQTLRDFQFNVVNCPQPPVTVGGNDITLNNGCSKMLNATGFDPTSITWTSIFPGAKGLYNNYLSCTSGCLNPTVSTIGSPPPYVDYVICGMSISCKPQAVCDTVRVTFNPTLVAAISPQNPTLCFGQTTTTLTVTGSGGTPPYSYLWNGVNTTQNITVGIGTYNIKLSDVSGCPPANNSVTVTSFSVAISANAGADQTICSQNNPIITLNGSVTGAIGGIWSGGSGIFSPNNTTLTNLNYTPTLAEINAGSISLYLTTTGNGICSGGKDTVVISFLNFNATISPNIKHVSCYGGNDGWVTISLSGGSNPFTYFWNNVPSQTTAIVNNLPIGTYSVTIQDGIGCTKQTSVNISEPAPLAVNATKINVTCSGENTGSLTTTPTGGTAPYNYSWVPGGQTTSSINNQNVGTYTVIIADAKNCQKTAAYTITQPSIIVITSTKTNVNCFNDTDGTITSNVSGGTSPYTYHWIPTNATSPNLSNVSYGTYTLVVTDNKGCTKSNSVIITQPLALTATITKNNETCDYLNNGTATASASGGTAPYTYSWVPGGQTTNGISNLSVGTYSITVSDSKGCSIISSTIITEPAPLIVNFVSQTNIICYGGNDGSITANPSGGTATYTYSWMPGGTTTVTKTNLSAGSYSVTVTDNKGCQTQNTITIAQPLLPISINSGITAVSCNGGNNGAVSITSTGGNGTYSYLWQPGNKTTSKITNLVVGTYGVVISDSKGCQITANYTITQPQAIAISFTPENVNCFGGSDGSATTTVSGGTSPYTYKWIPTNSTTPDLSGLSARTYSLTITDSKGCIAINSVNIIQPTKITAGITKTNETCDYQDDGTATANATGGTPGYIYSWQPGGETTATVSNLSSGTYTLIATDSKGCTGTTKSTITQPPPITITFSGIGNVSCPGGSNGKATSNPTGGTPNYKYSWMPGGQTTKAIANLSAGTYTVIVTDSKNCLFQNTITITEPPPISVALSFISPSCFGSKNGTVSGTASGGTPSYTYKWMPVNKTTQTISAVSAQTYTVTIKDANSCVKINSIAVTQPTSMTLTTTSFNSTCSNANGTTSVTTTGGTSPYTYQWSPTGGTNSTATNLLSGLYSIVVTDNSGCTSVANINVNDATGPSATIFSITNVTCNGGSDGTATGGFSNGLPPFTYLWAPSGGTNITATGLTAGVYVFSVIDANGCQSLATTTPKISEPPPIETVFTTTAVNCFGGNNGTAAVTASGGTPGFTYQWLPGGTAGSTITGLSASTYTVQVKDLNNCLQTSPVTITEPLSPLAVVVSASPVSCNSGADGYVSASALGGTEPYDYNWMSGNFNGDIISNLDANTYTVTTRDIMGCTTTSSVTVTQPTAITLTTGSINSKCSLANGQASVSASGGTNSYTYNWTPLGGTNAIAMGLFSGTYTITVTDTKGCTAQSSIVVNDNASPTVMVSSTTNVKCNGGFNGTATASVTGGASPFTYSWMPTGATGSTVTGLTTGIYTVTVTDANGCDSPLAESPLITEPTPISIFTTITNISCLDAKNGAASATASGGVPPYSYKWLPTGFTGLSINNLSAASYTLEVTDANNCIESTPFSVNQPTQLLASILSSNDVSCNGENTGVATVTVSGGTPTYNYSWLPSGGKGPTAIDLTAGAYIVSVSDFNGCTASSTVTITEPSQPLLATNSKLPITCFGGSNGSATINPSGGTPSYFYQWSPTGETGQTASNLSAGNYFIVVSDANGCLTNVMFAILQPPPLSATLAVTEPSCGLSNGSITPQISSGTNPYTYLWQPGSYTTASIKGLAASTYTLQLTDSLNCQLQLSASLINTASPTISLASQTNVSCSKGNDGSATITTNKGTSPFSFGWSPYGGTSLSATSLIAGTYSVIVTDDLGCTALTNINITEPQPLDISTTTINNVLCDGGNNGSVTVSVTGGTGVFTYLWSPATSSTSTLNNLSKGIYVVNVSDQNNCSASISVNITQPQTLFSPISSIDNPTCFNGINGSAFVSASGGTLPYTYSWTTVPIQNGNTANNISMGSYTITVTDGNGCISTNSVLITQPSQVITTAGLDAILCIGQTGTLNATATGGIGNYSYVWQPLGVSNSGTLTIMPTTNTTYTVVAYDQQGCQGTDDTVSVIVYSLLPANVQATGLTPICPGKSTPIQVLVSGNTGPLTYTWNNGLGNGPGIYIVTPSVPTTYIVTVSNLCGASVNDTIQILFNPPPTILLTSDTNSTCAPSILKFYDHSITGNVNDQIHYWYWTFGDGTSSTVKDPIHTYTLPGTYFVNLTVTTGNGCTNNSTAPLIINAFPYPVAAFITNAITFDLPYDKLVCTNQSTGADTYKWEFGDGGKSTQINPDYLYKSVGNYRIQLIATNQFGCPDTTYKDITTNADVIFPNVFTPNPDGPPGDHYNIASLDNDIFFPYTSGVVDFKLEIFNRWGELIFESFDITEGWDGYYKGQLCQQDVYIWKAYVKLNNGKIFNKTSDVTLLR